MRCRFLEVVSRDKDANVVGVDISNAVDAARKTLASRKNVHLVQASVYELPFRPETFDGVYCIGVIQHTPDPLKSVRSLPLLLNAGGKLALTIYEKRKYTLWNGKYLVRPLTRRMRHKTLLTALKVVMPVLWPVTEVLFRLPVVGKAFRFAIPIANYVDDPELSWRQRYQWAIMDTFDALSPAYDQPQTEADIRQVLLDEGLTNVIRTPGVPGLNMTAEKARHSG
jgi:SAM-dependent methyltransferase